MLLDVSAKALSFLLITGIFQDFPNKNWLRFVITWCIWHLNFKSKFICHIHQVIRNLNQLLIRKSLKNACDQYFKDSALAETSISISYNNVFYGNLSYAENVRTQILTTGYWLRSLYVRPAIVFKCIRYSKLLISRWTHFYRKHSFTQ